MVPGTERVDLSERTLRLSAVVTLSAITAGDVVTIISLFLCTQAKEVSIAYPVKDGVAGLKLALKRICKESAAAAREGYKLIILTDRRAGPDYVPVR